MVYRHMLLSQVKDGLGSSFMEKITSHHTHLQRDMRREGWINGSIFTNHELLFIYAESEEEAPTGRLATNHTPANWHEVMQPHFIPWSPEKFVIWKDLDCLYSFSD